MTRALLFQGVKLLTLLSFPLLSWAEATLPPLLQEVEEKYAKSPTLQADFTQINQVAAMKTQKVSSGILMVKRPNKLRWETLKPDTSLLVSDGKKFWFYTPPFDEGDRGQVIVKNSAEISSRITNALLSGKFSMAKDMKMSQRGEKQFTLIPKKGRAGSVEKIILEIDPEQKLIQKISLFHKNGDQSEIQLTHIEFEKPLKEELFRFTAPPNTDQISP